MSADNNPEHQSHYPVDQDPDGMAILAEHKKQADLNDPFGNENDAYYQYQKNDPEQRIYQEIDRSHTIQSGYESMPAQGAALEMNPVGEMSNTREHKKPA